MAEIFGHHDRLLGGPNMVFLGDLLQLAPVKNGPCFSALGFEEKKLLKSMAALNIWSYVKYDVRVGYISEEDERWLLDKCIFIFKSSALRTLDTLA